MLCPRCQKVFPAGMSLCPDDGEQLHDPAADLSAGYALGEYVVEEKIGEGGFGTVYRAVHPLIGKAAAVKVLSKQYSSNPEMVSRFVAEARAVNQIRNRNIIDIFSFGALADGRQYYVMELLDGMPLDRFLQQRGRLTPEEALPLLRGVAKAIDAAHGAGIAHRDLKPENIFVVIDPDGTTFPKLLDFGIAKLLGEAQAQHKTRTGTPIGTPHYMSPEQCRGRNVDHRTDIYSFGVVVHQVLTGRYPFDGDDVMDILFKQTSQAAPPMSSVCPAVPTALDAPVLHMLEKDPSRRPRSLVAAMDELAAAANAAGFDVPKPATGTHGSGPRIGRSAEGDIASARTIPVSAVSATSARAPALSEAPAPAPSRTLAGATAEADGKKNASSKAPLYVLATAVVLGLVGAAAVLARPGAAPKPAASGSATEIAIVAPPVAPASASAPTSPTAPIVQPSAEASASPAATAPPADVEITFACDPPIAVVFDGAKRLGPAAGPFKFPPGDATKRLVLRAPGYKDEAVDVDTTKSADIPVHMTKAPPKKLNSDLAY